MKFSIYVKLFFILMGNQIIYWVISTKEPVTLDAKSKLFNEEILRIVKFRRWTTFKIKDPVNKRIGEVKYGSIVVMKDIAENATERVVFLRLLKKSLEKYIIKIVTMCDSIPHTDEFLIIDGEFDKTCTKVSREPVDVNIAKIDKSVIKLIDPDNGWIEYSMKKELNLQYRIGNIFDEGTSVITDSSDANIRMRFLHVSKSSTFSSIFHLCFPFLPNTDQKLIRVFTYYNIGERSFDEYIETHRDGSRTFTELCRIPEALDLTKTHSRYIKRFKLDTTNYVYMISDEHKIRRKIGAVMNKNIVIANDDENIRIRMVYVDQCDTEFEVVEVKTCYKKGECKKCRYVLEENKYSESRCKNEKDQIKDYSSTGNFFGSVDKLDKDTAEAENYLQGIVSFKERNAGIKDIVLDVSEPFSLYFDIDILPSCNGIFFSMNKEFAGKNSFLNILDGGKHLLNVHLEKTSQVNMIVITNENNEKKLFMWIKCGIELFKEQEVILIDSLRNRSIYRMNNIELKAREFVDTVLA